MLPNSIMTRVDVGRLKREIEALDAFMHEASVRSQSVSSLPRSSSILEGLAAENKLNLLIPDQRKQLLVFLENLLKNAPTVHMSFASDPKPKFLNQLITWFRTEAHPHTLLHIGLQPEIAAGCVMRTTNRYFDFSFRERFEKSKPKLLKALYDGDTDRPGQIVTDKTRMPVVPVPADPAQGPVDLREHAASAVVAAATSMVAPQSAAAPASAPAPAEPAQEKPEASQAEAKP